MTAPCETRSAEEPGNVPPADEREQHGLRARWARLWAAGEAGMSTAEYAVGTVAACAFAAVLYRVVTGGSVVDGLSALVADALATLS
ncbi:DUF4244 domain-containing protein [Geodermatophilus sp. SYSU D01176]